MFKTLAKQPMVPKAAKASIAAESMIYVIFFIFWWLVFYSPMGDTEQHIIRQYNHYN